MKPQFVNSYYKTVEALTLKIWLIREMKNNKELISCINQCRENLITAQNLYENHLSTLQCKYAFHKLINETDLAEETRILIEKLRKKNV